MELKEGMYVITTDRLEIGKIIGFCKCEQCKERGFYEPALDNPNMFITNYDKERSFHGYKFYENLLDLIEVGDYVNGYKVYYCYCADEDMTGLFIDTETKRVWLDKPSQIKTIVTKQQFSSMEYRLGE